MASLRFALILSVLALVSCAAQPGASSGQARASAPGRPHVPGEVLVQFRAGTPPERIAQILREQDLTLGKVLRRPAAYVLKFGAGRDIEEVVARLKAYQEVRAADPNRLTFLSPPQGGQPTYREKRPGALPPPR